MCAGRRKDLVNEKREGSSDDNREIEQGKLRIDSEEEGICCFSTKTLLWAAAAAALAWLQQRRERDRVMIVFFLYYFDTFLHTPSTLNPKP